MKAAVLHEVGGVPRYEDFPDPVPAAGEVLVEVLAAALENVDKAVAAGKHYASAQYLTELPMIPVFDGVGRLADGTVVGFGNPRSPYGALAELTVVPEGSYAPIPDGVDPAVATVLASAITAMTMRTAAGLEPGETVLIQGATGVSGRLAIQVARLLGAGRIVASGRDPEQLQELEVDATVNTAVVDDVLREAYVAAGPYDVVLDFLWGRPTEMLLRALTPESFAFGKPTRIVQTGEVAGPDLVVPASALRTSGVELYGAGRNLNPERMGEAYHQVLEWTRTGKLTYMIDRVPLTDIETAWQGTSSRGRRTVIIP
ncbi:zinc-binding alcohol dehydrogenase family protein [Kribbella sp. NPDC026611]|uniref:quinone oxidoreductase family protein n=1 Tax=Kribbella sp. NPDC026611 TaxID=3154911 RepID=UPI0033DD7EC6